MRINVPPVLLGVGAAIAAFFSSPRAAQTVSFASDTTWEVFDADPASGSATLLGLAQNVCLDSLGPLPCPPGAITYCASPMWGANSWLADLSTIPGATWIWAPGVTGSTSSTVNASVFFSKEFNVAAPVGGTLSIAVDNFADVIVNGTSVGTWGSDGSLQKFDLTAFLVPGANRITVHAENQGAGSGIDYCQNPAGVVFGGTLDFLCFEAPLSLPLSSATDTFWATIGDLDADGFPDLAASSCPGNVAVFQGGVGGWTATGVFPAGTQVNHLTTGDINGDGDIDIAGADRSGDAVALLLGDGAMGLTQLPSLMPVGSGAHTVALADFDGNQVLDVAVVNILTSPNGLEVWLGAGGGAFGPSTTYPSGQTPSGLDVADLDLDGDLDCVVSNRISDDVRTFLGDGLGGFTPGPTPVVGNPLTGLDVADADGDGIPDVIVTVPDVGQVALLLGDGAGGFTSAQVFPVGGAPFSVAFADVDGDGMLDVATALGNPIGVSILRGLGAGIFAPSVAVAIGATPDSIEAEDLNGDGRADLVTANRTSVDVSVLLAQPCPPMIGSVSPTSAQFPGPVTVLGAHLDAITSASVQDIPASILSKSFDVLVLQPLPADPGFPDLDLDGSTGSATDAVELWPTLQATTTGVGGVVDVESDNGDEGLFVLALGSQALGQPLALLSPPTWYGILLDPAGVLQVIDTNAFTSSDPVMTSYPVPGNPALAGVTLYLQAWCQQGFFGPGVTYSFTNLASVTL